MRLADGVAGNRTKVFGRVEICIDQQWGTACGYNLDWGILQARVTCRELGYDCEQKLLYIAS